MSVYYGLNLKLNSHCAPLVLLRGLQLTLTWVRVSGFDLDGRAAPAVLLYLGHPLAGYLVGVISGAHGDLVLDDALDLQLLATAAANRRRVEPSKLQSSGSECEQRAVALWSRAGPVGAYWLVCHSPDIAPQTALCGKAQYPDSEYSKLACVKLRDLAAKQQSS